MFSNAMNRMDAAMSTSMSGGNQSPPGARFIADAIKVIECAMVKEVAMRTS